MLACLYLAVHAIVLVLACLCMLVKQQHLLLALVTTTLATSHLPLVFNSECLSTHLTVDRSEFGYYKVPIQGSRARDAELTTRTRMTHSAGRFKGRQAWCFA